MSLFFSKLINKILGKFEYYLAINWFSPIRTVYFNFRTLPFLQAIKLPIFIYGSTKFYSLTGNVKIEGNIKTGMIKVNKTNPGAPSNMSGETELSIYGTLVFGGSCEIGTGSEVFIGLYGILRLGNHSRIMDKVNIGCYKSISIGDNTRVAHRCQIFDSNYHYIVRLSDRKVKAILKTIEIGSDCWICNSTMIGFSIPKGTIVASNSLVTSKIDSIQDNCLIGGIPAKLITKGVQRVMNKETESQISTYFREYKEPFWYLPENYEIY